MTANQFAFFYEIYFLYSSGILRVSSFWIFLIQYIAEEVKSETFIIWFFFILENLVVDNNDICSPKMGFCLLCSAFGCSN